MQCFLGCSDGMVAGFIEPRRRFSGAIGDIGAGLVGCDIPLALPMAAEYHERAKCKK